MTTRALLRVFILILFCHCTEHLDAQRYHLDLDVFGSKILKHKSELRFTVPKISTGFEVSVVRKGGSGSAWEKYWGSPDLEVSMLYLNFGDNKVLGHAVAIMPGLSFKIIERSKHVARVHFSTGLSYLNKTFEYENNELNNAIGSHLNNATRVKFSYYYRIKEMLQIKAYSSFVHFSNGKTSSPNSGINNAMFGLGISKYIGGTKYSGDMEESLDFRRIGLNLQTTLGITESEIPGGPNYPIRSISLAGTYGFSAFHQLLLGVEYEYNTAIYAFQKHIFTEESIANDRAKKVAIFIGDELSFGSISQRFQLGYYLDIPNKIEGDKIYVKLITSYYPSFLNYQGFQLYIGGVLKSHYSVAEYLGIVAGVDF